MVAAAATVEEGLEIVDATVLYLNTLSSWLDASIPWSGIDVLPAVDVRGSGREGVPTISRESLSRCCRPRSSG